MRTGVVPLLLALVATLGLAGPSSAGHLPKEREWAFPQAFIMTRAYGTLNSCAKLQDAYAAKGWPQGRSLDTLRGIVPASRYGSRHLDSARRRPFDPETPAGCGL